MLDVDLKFRIDISELFRQFENFGPDQMIGVGPDLAPHYRIAFRHYRALHPDTQVGEPGPMQGFNTGVVLFNFARIRENVKYNNYVDNALNSTSYLAEKYLYRSHLGDQCFFTLLGMEHPGKNVKSVSNNVLAFVCMLAMFFNLGFAEFTGSANLLNLVS